MSNDSDKLNKVSNSQEIGNTQIRQVKDTATDTISNSTPTQLSIHKQLESINTQILLDVETEHLPNLIHQLIYKLNMPNVDCDTKSSLKKWLEDALEKTVNSKQTDAAVLLVMTQEDKPKILLTRRAGHMKSHAGEVSFPGGKKEAGDGNNLVTALRETLEEVALQPDDVSIIGQLPTQHSKAGLVIRPIVALVAPDILLQANPEEVEHIFWVELDTFLFQEIQEYQISTRINKQMIELLTPCWRVDGEVIWGLTGRIIASLLDIGFDKKIDWYYQPVC